VAAKSLAKKLDKYLGTCQPCLMPPFESRLAQHRERLGLSREDLAHQVGVSRQTIANIEQGKHEPGVLLGMSLAALLGASLQDLFRPRTQSGGAARMNRYRFQAARGAFFNTYSPAPLLTPEALAAALPGAGVRALVQLPLDGGYDVEVQLQRACHDDALDDIVQALGQFGLQLVQARITEIATATVETALVGGAGGGAIGSSSKDAGVTVAAALVGAAIGAAVGSQLERVAAMYMVAKPYPMGPWQLTPIPLRRPGDGQPEPG
jgi:putative transcriptional regulator